MWYWTGILESTDKLLALGGNGKRQRENGWRLKMKPGEKDPQAEKRLSHAPVKWHNGILLRCRIREKRRVKYPKPLMMLLEGPLMDLRHEHSRDLRRCWKNVPQVVKVQQDEKAALRHTLKLKRARWRDHITAGTNEEGSRSSKAYAGNG